MYSNADCTGVRHDRNVYDNTCAYTDGFQSFKVTTYGGSMQKLTAYNRQACAGFMSFSQCTQGVNKMPLYQCLKAVSWSGGSNALGSYFSADCPN